VIRVPDEGLCGRFDLIAQNRKLRETSCSKRMRS
jgi:hypothetical protein